MATDRRAGEGTSKSGSSGVDAAGDVLPVAAQASTPPPAARPVSEQATSIVDTTADLDPRQDRQPPAEKENSIRPSRVRPRAEQSHPVSPTAPTPNPYRETPSTGGTPANGTPDIASAPEPATRRSPGRWAVPDEVKERFVTVGRSYYFADGARAFQDRGKRLVSDTENTEVIRSLLAIAQERGWTDITVSGSERFRGEVWQQGQRAGLHVRGHRPNEAEKVQLARALAHQRTDQAPRGPVPPASDDPEPPQYKRLRAIRDREELLTGQLLQHGPATYRFDPREQPSYYVKLKTATGESVLWGKDLQRAIAESVTRVQVGDEIGALPVRRDAVQVRTPERDASGEVIGERKVDTHRNRWVVESRSFFEARSTAASALRDPRMDPIHIAEQHPGLVSEYVKLRGAELMAEQRIANSDDRRQFVAGVRERLAAAFERGRDPLPVYIQERRHRELLHMDRAPDRTRG